MIEIKKGIWTLDARSLKEYRERISRIKLEHKGK